MRVPLSWLRDYVAVNIPVRELANRLTVSCCNVERIVTRGVPDEDGNLGLYRVGRVLEAGKHPNADRLQLCHVDVGEAEPRQIVCGAWNFGAGATVAVGLPGAVLPNGERLERVKLRGTVSDGMILSEQELELGNDNLGIIVLPEPFQPGTPLAEVLPLTETIFEIEVTPNRPDLLAVYGIARETAALLAVDLVPPPGRNPPRQGDETVDVRIEDYEGCPRYIGRAFRDVRVRPSPPWLKARLVAADIRPISNVVDVTNYVMHALGNPLHAFDEPKLAQRRVVVRRARPGERIQTLDGQLRELDPRDLVIADAERPVAIAGIMGSLPTEVTHETTDVLLEAANFEPITILKTSERLGLRTEGSNRWEKGVDPYLAEQAARLATELIVELADATWLGETDVQGLLPERPVVRLRPERTDRLVGLVTPPVVQIRILERLGFEVGPGLTVVVPTWRSRDVTRDVDLIEEIARFRLDEVPFTLPRRSVMFGRLTKEQRLRRLVEDALVGCGLTEAYRPSLVSADPRDDAIRVPLPVSAELSVLRTTLVPSLIEAVRGNLAAGNEEVALFEIARVYQPQAAGGAQLPEEPWRVASVLPGGFERAKGVVETLHRALHAEPRFERAQAPLFHPGKTARLEAGFVGALHPRALEGEWGAFELDLAPLFERVPERIQYEDVVTFPAVRQDLAFVVAEDVPAGALVEAAREAAGPELRRIEVFDVYRGEQVGEGRKSVAFSVAFQSHERTLTDEDAAGLRARIVEALAERFSAELRA